MMKTEEVTIEIHKDFESFTAEVPELPGCVANGLTETEALENIQPLIHEWFENAQERHLQNEN